MTIRITSPSDLPPGPARDRLTARLAAETAAADTRAATQGRAIMADAAEAALQRDAEKWLQSRGYWPRSKTFLKKGRPPKGWYIHMHRPQGNPYLLDVFAWRLEPPFGSCEIELKVKGGRIEPAQRMILAASHWASPAIAWDLDEFVRQFAHWEAMQDRLQIILKTERKER